MENSSFSLDEHAVSSVDYDPYSEMVWIGQENGRVSGYSINSGNEVSQDNFEPVIKPYSSFLASHEYIPQILPNLNSVFSVSQSKICMHSYGGLPFGTITCPNFDNTEFSMDSFSAADMIRDPNVHRFSEAGPLSHIIAGTASNMAYIFDSNLVSGVDSVLPFMQYDLKSPVVKIVSTGHLFVAAGYDGNVRLLDGKLRSANVIKTLDAHSGTINDMCVMPDGRTLITCGLAARKINPYDPNSPSQVWYYVSSVLQLAAVIFLL